MTRLNLTLLSAAVFLSGCAASGEFDPGGARSTATEPMTPTQLAAYAGNARYPETQASRELRASAIVSRDKGHIKIYNFDNEPLRDVRVWVNGSFVQPIDGIAPQSSVTVRTKELYDGLGNSFASKNEEVTRVELQTHDQLHRLWGPAAE